jgi:hypothetical protein
MFGRGKKPKATSKKSAPAEKAKPDERAPKMRTELVRFAGVDVPIVRAPDGGTPFRNAKEVGDMKNLVDRYQNIIKRGRGR